MKIIKIKNSKGILLIEILVSILLLTIGIMSCLLFFTTANASSRIAKDATIATNHAEFILEEMRAKATLAEIKDEDWELFVVNNALNTLNNEIISIEYVDADADPLNITITVAWETGSRDHTIDVVTEMTK